MFEMLILMLDATIRTAPPLILAAMAGMFCERSGVVNIALEGKLLAAAFASAAAAAVSWLRLDWAGCRGGGFHPVRPAARLRHHHPPR